jgi:magnesium transporter
LLLAAACGLVLGAVGAVWSRHLPFGLVIGGAMTCSMLTAAFMGTIIPMLSNAQRRTVSPAQLHPLR